ncbi:cytidine deaminase [Ilumatobacter coccineus]|uniref:Cytidine deaminase n=1 Tax=Ilumatobacter coccineus (strain NBRC 103263 / KCTC 29153 / YM16-304) TaxID=1313172 RepID=A0A6C7E143_ILUCY|nr:cytidine deaminase [Ilumatobacter coccineus]BAN00947.1 cytidine deaminase [Ilumatobacter coccineus YM16-304]
MTTDVNLLDIAREARQKSYAPFSKFRAGAALETTSGDIVPGVIVENVSLGLAMCAERVALFAAVAQGQRPARLGLVAPSTDGDLTWPCGACLQVALELGGAEMVIEVGNIDGTESGRATVGELIPRGPKVDVDD